MKTEEQLATMIKLQDETVRILAASFSREYETQAAAAVALSRIGFASPRIAQLLGMPADSVRKAVTRAKSRAE